MKKFRTLNHKIIFYVMSVSICLALLITAIMSFGSIRSTNVILLDNMRITARIASQNISSNLHLLTDRMYNLSSEDTFLSASVTKEEKEARIDEAETLIEFVWLAAYDTSGRKLYGDEAAPDSIADTGYYAQIEKTGSTVIGEPYQQDGLWQLCVGAALKNEDGVIGYLVGSYKYDLLNDVLSLLILGNTGTAVILNEDGTVIGDRELEMFTSFIPPKKMPWCLTRRWSSRPDQRSYVNTACAIMPGMRRFPGRTGRLWWMCRRSIIWAR